MPVSSVTLTCLPTLSTSPPHPTPIQLLKLSVVFALLQLRQLIWEELVSAMSDVVCEKSK